MYNSEQNHEVKSLNFAIYNCLISTFIKEMSYAMSFGDVFFTTTNDEGNIKYKTCSMQP